MKICITEQSIKDFNAFFKSKALELQNKHNFSNLNDLVKALYNEALSLSGNTQSAENHDVIVQHLVMAPMALNNAFGNNHILKSQVSESLSKTLSALTNPTVLEGLIMDMQDTIATTQDIVEEEIDENTYDSPKNYDDLNTSDAIHVKFVTTQGSETIDFDNAIDKDKVPAFAAVRNVVRQVQKGSGEFKIMAMSYDKLSKNVPGVKFDFSVSQKPTSKAGQYSTVVFVITDKNGNPLQFDSSGNVVEKGTVPVYTPVSPTFVNTQFYYFNNPEKQDKTDKRKQLTDSMRLKFETLFQNVGKEQTIENIQWYVEVVKPLFKNIREAEYTMMDIDASFSTLGYSETTEVTTQLSEIKNIESFTLSSKEIDGDEYPSLTGSTLENEHAIIIPNDISTDPQLVETLIDIATNPNLTKNNVPLSAKDRRDLLSNYIGVGSNQRIHIQDDGTIRLYNKRVEGDAKEALRKFFTEFQIDKEVKGNPTNRPITKDLNSPNNTSAMLYQDASGKLFSIYKPKFSYNRGTFNSISIENNEVSTERIDKLQHVIKTGGTKSIVNKQKELRVYHPKIAYAAGTEVHNYTPKKSEVVKPVKTEVKKGVSDIFKDNPELSAIGTEEQYSQYLDSVFPDSNIKEIVYRGSGNPKKIEASDIKPEKGTGAKNLGIGIYMAKEKEFADKYAGDKGRTTAFIINVPNFFITAIQKNWDRSYNTPNKATVREMTGGRSDSVINFEYLDRDDYVEFNEYTGEYIGGVDAQGFPTMNQYKQMPYWTQLAVQSNEQVLALGSQQDIQGFKNFVEAQKGTSNNEYELNKVQEQKEANETVTKADEQRAYSWFKNDSPLSQVLELKEEQSRPRDTVGNRVAVAQFVGNGIVLYQGSDYTDIYHEAWHAYTQGILNQNDRNKLYGAVTKLTGLTNALEIEEFLAEEFRAYAIGKSKIKKNTVIGKFFQRIMDFLERMFRGYNKSDLQTPLLKNKIIRDHFKTLFEGKIDTSKYDTSKGQFKKLNKSITFPNAKEGKPNKLSAQDTVVVMDTLDSVMASFSDKNNADKLNRGYESVQELSNAYDHAKQKIESILQEEQKMLKENSGDVSSEAFKYHAKNIQVLQAVLDNFGDTKDIHKNLEDGNSGNNIISFHLKNGKIFNYNTIKSIIEEDTFPENEDSSATKNFERTGTEKSLYDMADDHIVYMLSTVPKYDLVRKQVKKGLSMKRTAEVEYTYEEVLSENKFGVANLQRPVVVIAKLGKLLNSSNNLDEMYAKMQKAAKTDSTIASVLQKLGPYNSQSLNQQLLWSKFSQTFSKSNNKLQQFIIEAKTNTNGDVVIESKYGSTIGGTKAVSRAWDSQFPSMTSDYLKQTATGLELNSAKIIEDFLVDLGNGKFRLKDKDGYVEFYRALGINITDKPEIELELSGNADVLNAIAQRLKSHVEVNEYKKEKGQPEVQIKTLKELWGRYDVLAADGKSIKKAFGLQGYYGKIQKIEFDLSDKYNSFMAVNANNENQSELSLNNSASVMTNDINGIEAGTSIEDIIAKNPHLNFISGQNDPFMRANNYHKKLFDQDGNRTKIKLTFENFSGSKLLQEDSSLGLTNMNLDRKSKFMTDVYLSFMGKSEVLRMSDKTTSMHMGIDAEQAFNPTNIEALTENDSTMFNELRDYLIAEIVRINTLQNIDGPFDQAYIERGGDFFIFDDILSKDVKKSLRKIKSTDFNEVSKALSKQDTAQIIKDVNGYFATKAEKMISENSQSLFVTDNMLSTIDNAINSSKTESERTPITKEKAKEIMINMFARNKFLHNLDMTTFYLGDPALYNVTKEDFHKRNAGLISTGDVFRTDKSFYDFINSKDENGMMKSRGWSNTVTGKTTYDPHQGTLNTAVIKDRIVTDGTYSKEYSDILGKLGEYGKMTEADGQGFISFDTYRLLSIAQGIWTTEQEEQYNIIVSTATTDANGNIVPGKYDQRKYSTFFPSMKLQHFGPMANSGPLRQQGFHKFNLVPLIPGMIQGTKLEQLHKSMMEQGIDYMTFESGSKLSTISKSEGIDNYYDENRNINDDVQFEKNVIYTKYLKNQLKIHNKFKGKVTLPTQMRSILVSDLYNEDGTYKSPEHEKWHKDYLKALYDLSEFKKEELLNELGVKDNFSVIKDSAKLVNLIRREFTDKDYAEHQIEFLFDNDKLKSDLSTALTSDQVEKLLVALVDKRITKLKVNGEGLIQVASSMTEEKGKGKIVGDEAIKKEQGSNGLRFYYNRNGEIRSMQVKIALQGDFEKLLYTKDADGKKIAVYDQNGEFDYDASLANLNKAIKDERWLNENKELIQIAAPRVPSQFFNSLEFIEIAEFLPKNSLNIMVVPTELVAKAGSDFDVDKLFTMFPNIAIYSGKAELVKYIDIDTDVQTLENQKYEKTRELEKFNEENNKKLQELFEDVEADQQLVETNKELYPLYKERNELRKNKDVLSKERLKQVESEIEALRDKQGEIMGEALEKGENAMLNKDLKADIKENWKAIKDILSKRDKLQTEIDNIDRKINGASSKGLENNLLKLIIKRLQMESVYRHLIKPNDTSKVKPLADELAEVATDYNKYEKVNGEEVDPDNKKISPTQIFDPMYNINKQIENSVGMDTLGVGAIGSKFAAIFSSIGMYLNPTNGITRETFNKLQAKALDFKTTENEDKLIANFNEYTIQLPHNVKLETVNGEQRVVIDLSKTNNVSGESIPDLLGQLINGWVDVAKDAWVFNIQGNKEVAPTLIFLITAGVDLRQAVMLSSSKKVREYIEAKRTMNSAFYGLSKFDPNNKNTHDLISNYNDVDALNLVLQGEYSFYKIEDVYQDSFDETGSSLDMTKIEDYVLNPNAERSVKELEEKEKQEIAALLQFVAYEQTAKQIKDLTMATKFDTTTSSNLADIRNKKNDFKNLNEKRALPSDIKSRMKNQSPVGMFDTNDLQLDLWSQFFGLKTHPIISEVANDFYRGNLYVKGRTKADNEREFGQEFVSYLYQNEYSRIEDNSYLGVKIKEKQFEDSEIGYELKDGVFYYDPLLLNSETFPGYGNTNSLIKYTIAEELAKDSPIIKDSVDYELAKNEYDKLTDKEKEETSIEELYAQSVAVLLSGNQGEMFYGPFSYAARFDALKNKHPYLEKEYDLVRDLTPNFENGKANLFLSNIKEAGYIKVYSENLEALKEHPDSEISEFFQMFDRFAVLQSGTQSYGSYVMTQIIDQNHIEKYVGPIKNDIIKAMDKMNKEEMESYPVIDDFVEKFYKIDMSSDESPTAYKFKKFLATKHRGNAYESDAYFEAKITTKDKAEMNIDSIKYVNEVDKIMAKEADKVIVHTVLNYPNPKAGSKSKVSKYKKHISQFYPDAVTAEYDKDSIVWISGELSSPEQYGSQNNKARFNVILDDLFESKYRPQIEKAIASGVSNFSVGSNSGIDSRVQKFFDKVSSNVQIVKRYSLEDAQNNPDKIYIFGDNTQREGKGGQAAIRDASNAFGIATKLQPNNKAEAFMTDDSLTENKKVIDSDIAKIKADGRPVVFPKDGLGTGLAKLKEKAPKTFEYLNQRLMEEFGFDNQKGTVKAAEKIFTKHKIVKPEGTYFVYAKQKELVVDEIYSTLGGEVVIQDAMPSLTMSGSVSLSIGNKSYNNLYKYLAANKLRFASKEERSRVGERVEKMGENITIGDWINLINDIKIDSTEYDNYNEWKEIGNAMFAITKTNPKLKNDLKDTGKVLLTFGKGITRFEKNYAKALMELRKHFNGPVTQNLDNNQDDIFTCKIG